MPAGSGWVTGQRCLKKCFHTVRCTRPRRVHMKDEHTSLTGKLLDKAAVFTCRDRRVRPGGAGKNVKHRSSIDPVMLWGGGGGGAFDLVSFNCPNAGKQTSAERRLQHESASKKARRGHVALKDAKKITSEEDEIKPRQGERERTPTVLSPRPKNKIGIRQPSADHINHTRAPYLVPLQRI